MDDYAALAQRISVAVSGVSGALILSRDGLVLGAYPTEDESLAKPAWLRFVTLGEPERSFVEFPDQVWAYVKRGPYAAFATAEAGTRPGVLVDQMEQVLLVAEEGRARRDTLRVPDVNAAPSGKPRTSLHPQREDPPIEVSAPVGEPVVAEAGPAETAAPAEAAPAEAPRDRGAFKKKRKGGGGGDAPAPVEAAPSEPVPPAGAAADAPRSTEPKKLAGTAGPGFDDDAEVDRVLLAKEFSGLLQVDSDDDEGSS